MNHPTTNKPQRTSSKGECCTESSCESGLRNNYFDGKRLTTDSFRVEQTYMQGRRHLLNRAMHGWGVVYGYELGVSDGKQEKVGQLQVGPGLALDKCGRELVETGTTLQFNDVILFDKAGKRATLEDVLESLGISSNFPWDNPPPAVVDAIEKWCWVLSVHYAERDRAHVELEDQCRCKRDEWDHLCETVYYSIRPVVCKECCAPLPCGLDCECGTGPCCQEKRPTRDPHGKVPYSHPGNPEPIPHHPHQRGGCQCLCTHLTGLAKKIGGECDSLCEMEEPCGSVRVDINNGVPLACVKLAFDKCGLGFGDIYDACGPRRLVKRNDLLFDLIRGCDLTQITNIGWDYKYKDKDVHWHRSLDPIPFEAFQKALGEYDPNQDVFVSELFWVEFSRPVRADTLRPDCFAMTVMSTEREGGWWQTFRVPIVDVDTTLIPAEPNDPPGHVRSARIVVDGPWLGDAVGGRRTIFLGGKTWVEFEVRGDFIVDCNGQTVDANPVGLSPVPTGNGTPGGTFLSTFSVDTQHEKYNRSAQNYSPDPGKGVSP
jgi:hypothetical protein